MFLEIYIVLGIGVGFFLSKRCEHGHMSFNVQFLCFIFSFYQEHCTDDFSMEG